MLATASAGSQTTMLIIWLVAFGAIMYFMMWRPQKKEQNRVKAMLSSMEVGDVVVTTSGFYGVLIDITDDDYGIWYMDAADDKDRYEGKTVRFTARIMKNRKLPKNFCVPGRKAMTCCAEDIRFIGFLCKYPELDNLKNGDWVTLTANMHYERRREYGGVGPVLYATEVVECAAPEDELVYFN